MGDSDWADDELNEMLDNFEVRHSIYDIEILLRLGAEFQAGGDGPYTHSAFVIMKAALPYVETMEQYRNGFPTPKGKATKTFENGLHRLFPELGLSTIKGLEVARRLRHGLLHTNVGRDGIGLTREISVPILVSGTDIDINPYQFVLRLKKDLDSYLWVELRGPGASPLLIQNFKAMYVQELQPSGSAGVCTTTPAGNEPVVIPPPSTTTPAANCRTTTTTTSMTTTPGANPPV